MMPQILDIIRLELTIGIEDSGEMYQMVIHSHLKITVTFLHELQL